MSWEKSSYTTAGAALLSESLSGGALTITRAMSGTGIVETDLSAETTVSGETHELTILAIDTVKDGEETARKVSIQITGAESTYIMHQLGVYGRLNDDAEVLLFIMQDERGIEVPASSVNADFEIEIAALIAISNKAKHADEAWEFIKWWTTQPENGVEFCKISGNMPANKAAAEDPYFADDDVFEVFTEAYTYAGIRSKVLGYSDVEGLALIPQLQKYVAGEISAEEALANAQSQGASILAEAAQQ